MATPNQASTDPLTNIGRTSVIAVTVSAYQHLPRLEGPRQDAIKIRRLFSEDSALALYGGTATQLLENPTGADLRETLTTYAANRGARGDILIFYFSGHGALVGGPGNEFGFCTVDTRRRPDGGTLPLSLVSFRDVVRTLAMVDVHPVFIIDACFSSAISGSMHDDLHRHMGGSYAFLCSSHETTESLDFADGGAFTNALFTTCTSGIGDKEGKRRQCLTLGDLAPAIIAELEILGYPLSRCHIGPDLPSVPIARNIKFTPKRYKFTGYFVEFVMYLYNDGNPRAIKKVDISLAVGTGAYGNHNKLSYAPWGLVQDGSESQTRELTERGIEFAEGKLSVPSEIEEDPITGEWRAVPGTDMINRIG